MKTDKKVIHYFESSDIFFIIVVGLQTEKARDSSSAVLFITSLNVRNA